MSRRDQPPPVVPERDRYALLRDALVTDEHARLYHTSLAFRSAIDTLGYLIPTWIDALARDAAEADAARRAIEPDLASGAISLDDAQRFIRENSPDWTVGPDPDKEEPR